MIKCFYHSADFDGFCSAAIVLRAHPDAKLYPINYGDSMPWEELEGNDSVYMVDFSLQPFTDMIKLKETVKELIWIDHHKTAIEAHQEYPEIQIGGIRKIGTGACQLVWDYLFPNKEIPKTVWHLARYDVWEHSHVDTLPFQYGIRSTELNSPSHPEWSLLLSEKEGNTPLFIEIRDNGVAIQTHEQQQNSIRAASLAFTAKIHSLTVLAANQALSNSKFFDSRKDDVDALCLFSYSPKLNSFTFSLYSRKEGVDVSKVAKQMGGGGHAGAAGFHLSITETMLFLETKHLKEY